MGNQSNHCGEIDSDIAKQISTTQSQAIKRKRSEQFIGQASSTQSIYPVPSHQCLTTVSQFLIPLFVKKGAFYVEENQGLCLDEIVQCRYKSTMHFPQSQMIALLESLVYALRYLSGKNIPHHDFYPTNVFYKNGKFKVLNPVILPCSGYSLTQQRKRFSFLSPQLVQEVIRDTPQTDISQEIMHKGDIFSIGMIMLQFCTLEPSSECYDAENYSILHEVVYQRMKKCSRLYNPQICHCIQLMLQYQVNKRITPRLLAFTLHQTIANMKRPISRPTSRPPSRPTSPLPPQFNGRPFYQPMMIKTHVPQVMTSPPPQKKVQQKPLRSEVKLNPFQQIKQEQENVEEDNLDERVKRVLEDSRILKRQRCD